MSECYGCGKTLGRRNVSGACRKCFVVPPDVEGVRAAKLRAFRAKQDPAMLRAHMASVSRTRMAWCPLEYQAEYRRMTRHKHIPPAEARAIILDQVEADRARYRATGRLPQSQREAA